MKSYAAFTPAQLVARNKHQVARSLLRATCCAGVNAALEKVQDKFQSEFMNNNNNLLFTVNFNSFIHLF